MIIIEWVGYTIGIYSVVLLGLGITIGIYVSSQIQKSINENIKK